MDRRMGKLITGVISILIAIVLFVVASIDSIQIIGKYRVIEMSGVEIDEWLDDMIEDYEPNGVKYYISFNMNKKIDFDIKISNKVKNLMESEDEEIIDEMMESLEKELKKTEWSIKNDKIIMEYEDNKTKTEYELKGSELILDNNISDSILKKEGLDAILCPSGLLNIGAILLAILGIIMLILSFTGKKPTYVSGLTMNCPKCGGPIPDGSDFCINCGFSFAASGGAVDLSVSKVSSSVCTVCGNILKAGDKFCENCGSPVSDTMVETLTPPTPAMPSCAVCGNILKAGDKFCENCGSPVGGSAPSAPVTPPPSTPKCAVCGNILKAGDKFCENCGSSVGGSVPSAPVTPPPSTPKCAVCGSVLKAGDRFCENCGSPVTAGTTAFAEPEKPGLRSTFKTSPSSGSTGATYTSAPSATISNDNSFKPAGDL